MDKYIVIKNGLVLTLDRKSQAGYFNIIVKNNKIFIVDVDGKFNEKEFRSQNPDAEIIDAANRIVMPGFFNSKLVSSYSLNKIFFKKCTYENLSSWLSLRLIDKYLTNIENAELLKALFKISYDRSLRNGEIFINEASYSVNKDFFDIYFTNSDWVKQYYNLTIEDTAVFSDLRGQEKFLSMGFRIDEDINNYFLSAIKKTLSGYKMKLFIEASFSHKMFESMKKIFGKPFINALSEKELITSGTILSNPTHLSLSEIDILKRKGANILISASDYINFYNKKIDFEDLISSEINLIIGTGFIGNDILSELKILSCLVRRNCLSSESLMKMAIHNPSLVFGIENVTGSIERNKSADMIFFSLDDIRNTMTLPEIESESLCEFVIQNLSVKDISEVIVKGEVLIKNKKNSATHIDPAQKKAGEISNRIYAAGKYHEFKEKYLMRGRVDKLSNENIDEPDKSKQEIYVDMTEIEEYLGEGEFTILGAREEEFGKPREKLKDEFKKISISLKQIDSIENELNLFDDVEEPQQVFKLILPGKGAKKDKIIEVKDTAEIDQNESDNITLSYSEIETQTEEEEKEDDLKKTPVQFKEKKLKFGFTDE